MNRYTTLHFDGYEEVVQCNNEEVGFVAWIAIHNSNRGPALGGCRVWNYKDKTEGLTDVLRLSRGMTYKNALARLPLGGGKAVVHADLDKLDRTWLFSELGKFVETFNGKYITAEDVNSTVDDMAIVRSQTKHVATVGASGNPSPFTAYGVYCAIKTSVFHKFGRTSLDGLKVAIQGVGETGCRLAQLLYNDKCQILAADLNSKNLKSLQDKIKFELLEAEDIYSVPCDIFAPCALGSILNDGTIPQLKCQIVAGSANNQLATEQAGTQLYNRSILYAPDFAINSGGVINISCEIGQPYDASQAKRLTEQISSTLSEIYELSKEREKATNLIANQLAEELFINADAIP